jgi:hypothetical protein
VRTASLVSISALLLAVSAFASASRTTWAWIVASSNPPQRFGSAYVEGLSCATASHCVTVGTYGGNSKPFAFSWDGRAYRSDVVPLPADAYTKGPGTHTSQLKSVACPTQTECLAVGSYEARNTHPTGQIPVNRGLPLAEYWDGRTWATQPLAAPPQSSSGRNTSGLAAISCPSARSCTSVGYYNVANDSVGELLAESWNGTTWSLEQIPDRAAARTAPELTSVSCVGARFCMAVGWEGAGHGATRPFTAIRRGGQWKIAAAPTPAGLGANSQAQMLSVSCSAATACVAVGSYIHMSEYFPLAESWNGKRWTIRRVPAPTDPAGVLLFSVSCSTKSACSAVGGIGGKAPLAERWNGQAWTTETVARGHPGNGVLADVSCGFGRGCIAASGEQSRVLALFRRH